MPVSGRAFIIIISAYLVTHFLSLSLAVDMRDAGEWTGLHHAVCQGRAGAVQTLLDAGAAVNIADQHGVTALHIAAAEDNVELFRLLLENKADPKMSVSRARNKLPGIRASNRNLPTVQADSRDSYGRSPLGLAMWEGNSEIVDLLLQKNQQREKVELTCEDTDVCELTACRPDGMSLLHVAAEKGYLKLMKELLSLKVNPNLRNAQGATPLTSAICNNQLACIQNLLDSGAKLSITDKTGASALHVAAKIGNVMAVTLLLNRGKENGRNIDINKCDHLGYTPAYYAINEG
ncbi:hypothetical protein HAZT_HAZT000209, partial [Hyalella azteca]